jgi:hypothetical protein
MSEMPNGTIFLGIFGATMVVFEFLKNEIKYEVIYDKLVKILVGITVAAMPTVVLDVRVPVQIMDACTWLTEQTFLVSEMYR